MRRVLLLAAFVEGVALATAPDARAADPKAECLAAADQGQSLRDDGKYRRARDAFVTCSRDTCPKVVSRSCVQWLRQLDDATPTIVLGAKDDTGADLTTANVTVDGQPLTASLDGKPLPVDPGEHVLHFERSGNDPVDVRVVFRAGDKNRSIAVTLHATGTGGPVAPPPDDGSHSSFLTARNIVALSLLVVGAGTIGGGAYFLSQSGSESSTAAGIRSGLTPDECSMTPAPSQCAQLKSAVDAQNNDSTIGTVMIIAGGVVVAGAVITWLVWPKPASPADEEKEKAGIRWIVPGFTAGGVSLGMSGFF